MDEKNLFEVLNNVDVNEHKEDRNGFTYLSWAWAWQEVMKRYPDATYEIVKAENGLPYVASELGVMVFTRVTIKDMTREMWLPVMDSANRALKLTPYTIKTKYGEQTINAATMFDVNKAIMRCLVKNLAMFGLGLYIYAGEDLPEMVKEEKTKQTLASWVNYAAQQDVNGLAAMYGERKQFAEDKSVINAMYDQLHAIIKNAETEQELGTIYKVSKWAQTNQQVVDWCAERKAELKQAA